MNNNDIKTLIDKTNPLLTDIGNNLGDLLNNIIDKLIPKD